MAARFVQGFDGLEGRATVVTKDYGHVTGKIRELTEFGVFLVYEGNELTTEGSEVFFPWTSVDWMAAVPAKG